MQFYKCNFLTLHKKNKKYKQNKQTKILSYKVVLTTSPLKKLKDFTQASGYISEK